MGASQLTEQVRKRLVTLITDDRPDPERLMARIREFRALEGVSACALVVHLIANVEMAENEAEQLLADVLAHRDEVRDLLGRDPGLRVAAIDYMTNVKSILRNPTIVELAQLERTERSAITDDLTGLYNRRYLQTALDVEVRRSRRYVLPLSVLMLDLDAFKSVNDLYGHPFGDLVLQLVGQVIRRAVRESDLACRVGGEEFAVVLPETDRLGGYAVAERIRVRVEKTFAERPVGGRAVAMTVSGGVASYPEDADDPNALIALADKALYQSKMRGRNRIVIYHSERRSAIRYPVPGRPLARLSGQDACAPREARMVNLSSGGALLELGAEELPPEPLELTLEARDGRGKRGADLCAVGRVVRDEFDDKRRRRLVAIAFNQPLGESELHRHVVGGRAGRAAREGQS